MRLFVIVEVINMPETETETKSIHLCSRNKTTHTHIHTQMPTKCHIVKQNNIQAIIPKHKVNDIETNKKEPCVTVSKSPRKSL